MSFLVLINSHFLVTHRETFYRSFILIHQVDKHFIFFIYFFCLAMLCTVLPFHLQQSNYAINFFFFLYSTQPHISARCL